MADDTKMKLKWLDIECEYCGNQMNSWDKRVSKALMFDENEDICENCIAEE